VLKAQGRRGEVLAELHTDFPERFEERRKLWGLAPDGGRRELQLQEHWFHKGGVVLKFAGVDGIDAAQQLAGFELQVPQEQRSALEAGSAYVSELVGCDVWDGQRFLGRVSEVQFGAGEAPLLVVTLPVCAARPTGGGGKTTELLVPFAAEFVSRLDLQAQRIEMHLPEGLLDVDAPLSEEEKQRQKIEADEARSAGQHQKRS
jgi:16S rRNA processing protein RimM